MKLLTNTYYNQLSKCSNQLLLYFRVINYQFTKNVWSSHTQLRSHIKDSPGLMQGWYRGLVALETNRCVVHFLLFSKLPTSKLCSLIIVWLIFVQRHAFQHQQLPLLVTPSTLHAHMHCGCMCMVMQCMINTPHPLTSLRIISFSGPYSFKFGSNLVFL